MPEEHLEQIEMEEELLEPTPEPEIVYIIQYSDPTEMREISPEIVSTVTTNVVTITAVILVAYAVMEILKGLLNLSSWLFEQPAPKLFKGMMNLKPKKNPLGADND